MDGLCAFNVTSTLVSSLSIALPFRHLMTKRGFCEQNTECTAECTTATRGGSDATPLRRCQTQVRSCGAKLDSEQAQLSCFTCWTGQLYSITGFLLLLLVLLLLFCPVFRPLLLTPRCFISQLVLVRSFRFKIQDF